MSHGGAESWPLTIFNGTLTEMTELLSHLSRQISGLLVVEIDRH